MGVTILDKTELPSILGELANIALVQLNIYRWILPNSEIWFGHKLQSKHGPCAYFATSYRSLRCLSQNCPKLFWRSLLLVNNSTIFFCFTIQKQFSLELLSWKQNRIILIPLAFWYFWNVNKFKRKNVVNGCNKIP